MRKLMIILLLCLAGRAMAQECMGPYKGQKLSQAQLDSAVAQHALWMRNKQGEPINLCGTDLSGLNFDKKNLSFANFYGADLSNASFKSAIFQDASLQKTYFRGSNLENADFERANFMNANLEEANLKNINLEQTIFEGASLSDSNLEGAIIRGSMLANAKFDRANLKNAELSWVGAEKSSFKEANLENVNLSNANLESANFQNANLLNANLSESTLKQANFDMSILRNVNFFKADLEHVIYHPQIDSIPNIIGLASAKNFKSIKILDFKSGAPSLAELRTAYKKSGMRTMERMVTSILKTNEMMGNWTRGGTGYIEAAFSYLLFYITSDFGSAPGRPLRIFLILIFVFTIPYKFALSYCTKNSGIIAFWEPKLLGDRRLVHKPFGSEEFMLRLKPHHCATISSYCKDFARLIRIALYFSVITAFKIGWRELNVCTWITRLQSREYRLQAFGWVRIVAGLQSLIGAYLIVLWAFTYFGRPFEW